MKVKKIDENGVTSYYTTLQEASKSIDSKLENWKIQLFISDAIINKSRAFKCKWELVK